MIQEYILYCAGDNIRTVLASGGLRTGSVWENSRMTFLGYIVRFASFLVLYKYLR